MKKQMILLALPIALLVGCVGSTAVRYDSYPRYEHADVYYRSGPPPHAPAHGYRHHYHNHDMIYDSGIRAYIIVGLPDYYYDNGFYFRYSDLGWQISGRLDGRWDITDERRVPKTLWNTRAKKHYYDNDQRGRSYDYRSDKDQPRKGHQDNRGNSDKDQYRNGHQDNRSNSDKGQSKNDQQNNRGNSYKDQYGNSHQDYKGNSDKNQSRNDKKYNRRNSDKDHYRNDQQDNRGNSDKNQSRNDQNNNDKDHDGYKDRNDNGYRY